MSGAQMSLYTLFRMYNSPNRSASQVHRERYCFRVSFCTDCDAIGQDGRTW